MAVKTFGMLAVLLIAAQPAAAETWEVAPGKSTLTFSYLENGAPIEGKFTKFGGKARFTHSDLSDARVEVDVSTASVTFGDPLRDHFARSVDWFDVKEHPEAAFELTGLTPVGEHRYKANGTLEIRGAKRPVTADLKIDRDSGALSAAGDLTFKRADFGVGVGFSAMMADIGETVTVHFDLTGQRVD